MAVSRVLRRLRRVRELEEEQQRLALEAALSDLHVLQAAQQGARERGREGRRLIIASVQTGEVADRAAGIEEMRAAQRRADWLEASVEEALQRVNDLRKAYLSVRVERRQAETLIEEAEARDRLEDLRKGQQNLDDWHRARAARKH
ncbi:MAG: hypothetical protein P4L10_16035 [Acidobacteriaceae bacterium]|nr:hypothetical protein [Acidobacteriaceae bacterium]